MAAGALIETALPSKVNYGLDPATGLPYPLLTILALGTAFDASALASSLAGIGAGVPTPLFQLLDGSPFIIGTQDLAQTQQVLDYACSEAGGPETITFHETADPDSASLIGFAITQLSSLKNVTVGYI